MSPAAADPPTTTFYLDSANQNGSLGGVFTSPYTGHVGDPTSPMIPVICDDFVDNSIPPQQWTAYMTSLSDLKQGSADGYLRWGTSNSVQGTYIDAGQGTPSGSWILNQALAYDVAAILSIEILNASPGSAQQQDLSYALWGLFDSANPTDLSDAFNTLSTMSLTEDLNAAENDLANAINQVQTMNSNGTLSSYLSNYNVTIYTYAGLGCSGNCDGPPQEFMTVTTPEASAPVLLAVDLSALFALLGFLRKRIPKHV